VKPEFGKTTGESGGELGMIYITTNANATRILRSKHSHPTKKLIRTEE